MELEYPSIIYYFQRISTMQLLKISKYYFKKVQLNNVIKYLHLQVSIEQSNTTPVGDQ